MKQSEWDSICHFDGECSRSLWHQSCVQRWICQSVGGIGAHNRSYVWCFVDNKKKVLVRQTKRGRAKKSRITKRFRAQEGWIYEARPSGIFPSGANHDRIFCSIDFLSHSVRWRVNRGAFVSAGGRCSGFCAGHSQYDGAKE